jgi:filamentous hemagglutinin
MTNRIGRGHRGQFAQRTISLKWRHLRAAPDCKQHDRPLWMRATAAVMTVVMYFAPAVLLADQAARAAPIVDPRAPIAFQPSVTQASNGASIIGITAPNAQGLSVNQFQSLSSNGAASIVFNNSQVAGTSLTGGPIAANPNLAGRATTTILNQVTSTAPSTLAGPVEIFGSPASLIISNPNGVTVQGLSVANAQNLVLTTGVPQFITAPGDELRAAVEPFIREQAARCANTAATGTGDGKRTRFSP